MAGYLRRIFEYSSFDFKKSEVVDFPRGRVFLTFSVLQGMDISDILDGNHLVRMNC